MALIQGTTAVPQAVAKLITTIADEIPLFLEPTHIRRKGRAEAEVRVYEAKAEAEKAVLKVENKLAIQDIQDRAAERVRKREARRQANLEAIVAQAARELPEDVTDVPVDDDWLAQFFNHCQDVSNEQMQTIWARFLAEEVARPGSFSLRTLAVVRVLSKEDADLFTRFCSMVWQTADGLTPIIPDTEKAASLQGVNLGFTEFVHLDAIGLIRFATPGGFGIKFTDDGLPRFPWRYHGRLHVLSKKDARQIDIGRALFTEVGEELATIAGPAANEEYRSWVVATFRENGWEVVEHEAGAAPDRGGS